MWTGETIMGLQLGAAKAFAACGGLVLLLAADGAQAQQPSPDQISAIRQSCRSDFMANCSGVQPGGKDALECLKQNLAKLSGSCKTAVSAIVPPPAPAPAAPAAAPPVSSPAPAGVTTPAPASPKPTVAPASKPSSAAVPKPAQKPAAPAPASAAAAAPSFPPLGPVRPMLPQRALIIRAICHADQEAFCAGVPPLGPAILSCLAENGPHLSPECYKALAPVTR
jgi:hypothetical protein